MGAGNLAEKPRRYAPTACTGVHLMSTSNTVENSNIGAVPQRSASLSQSYYETEAIIPPDHRLVLDLPADVPAGPVRLAIIYRTQPRPARPGIKELLMAMPDVGTDEDFARRQDLGPGSEAWNS
jgi:hypothetical protein